MNKRLFKIIYFLTAGALLWGAGFYFLDRPVSPATAAAFNLDGRILLQVEDKGQAWYVNPLDSRRYYLGRPTDAFNIMRTLGLGVTNRDLSGFLSYGAPARLSGRILLQVEDKGQAYYIDPVSLKLFFLGSPTNAFNVIRQRGLGISNANLDKIAVATGSLGQPSAPTSAYNFSFKYQNNPYNFSLPLSQTLYDAYRTSSKVYTYYTATPPQDTREAFYNIFLQSKSGDFTLDDLVNKLKAEATSHNWTSDQLAEFTLAFVQYIPYDSAKLNADPGRNINPYFPYETLYLNRGVCSDKTFLAVTLLRRLGYGAAILDFPDINHSAVGIQCPLADSLNASGYCYAETTNYFPLGVIPQNISGQARTETSQFASFFNPAILGKIEIYQKTTGKIYTGVPGVKAQVASLQETQSALSVQSAALDLLANDISAKKTALNEMKARLDAYAANNQNQEYNDLVPTYNSLVGQYNAALAGYQSQVNAYNQGINNFNQATRSFYQQ